MTSRSEDLFPEEAAFEWSHLVPEVDASTVEIALRLRRSARRLEAGIRSEVALAGLSSTGDYETVALLFRRQQLRPTEIAKELGITPAGMNGRMKRLVAKGFVEQVPDPDDGRSFSLQLTASGREATTQGFRCAYRAYETLLESLSRDEIEALRMLLAKVRNPLT